VDFRAAGGLVQAEDGGRVRDLDEPLGGRRADTLRGRVGRDQLRVCRLQRPQFIHQRIVLGVADDGLAQHVVTIVMIVDLAPQLRDTCDNFKLGHLSH